ncbi:MAG: hypothetical protein JNN30_19575 [Rhodanobacteraceae bacterium]|nr:hypothetical protein [Rhodanobacteraceae bacterium]
MPRLFTLIPLLFAAPLQAADGLGMTFGNNSNESTGDGVVFVTCHGLPRTEGGSCNPYSGDTSCATRLPLLCLEVDGRPRPPGLLLPPAGSAAAMPSNFYAGWAAGRVAATSPIAGHDLRSAQAADTICRNKFGHGWRMAEFHDGIVDAAGNHGGWAWYAHGQLDTSTRYWVRINDQPGNCWDGVEDGGLQAGRGTRPKKSDGKQPVHKIAVPEKVD